MSKQREQVILGSLLGNGFICQPNRKNTFLTITETKDLDWLKYKAFIIDPRKQVYWNTNRYIWKSSCSVEWGKYRQKFYKDDKKVIDPSMLNLWAEGLAVWFLDRGKFKGNRICISTTSFGLEGSKIIEQYFNEVGMPCRLWKDRNTGRIMFTKEGSKILMATIAQAVPRFMFHRLVL